ncbi:hypothetical protein [Leyella lascolaii]|mgnify:CR=1 FL=1|uniref:hypothetical protein n=1 Tax=Leyella lascolaii TaxID=1776379 RepID=UPI00083B2CA5|nr:hypothetical protein [Leyella lascolaii]
MNRRSIFSIFIFCLVLVGCKNNEYENQSNIIGDWYVCQYWGEEKREETDVYEPKSGPIRNIEHPEKTQTKHWDNSYNYGENIISFKENQSMFVNTMDFEFEKYVSYILDNENSKLICINGNNKVVYNLLEESNAIILSREYNGTYESIGVHYVDLNLGESGIIYTIINYNTKEYIKLKRIN